MIWIGYSLVWIAVALPVSTAIYVTGNGWWILFLLLPACVELSAKKN